MDKEEYEKIKNKSFRIDMDKIGVDIIYSSICPVCLCRVSTSSPFKRINGYLIHVDCNF